ncbi:hypothetical protein VKUWNCZY_CDS0022 [Escherichia phage KS_A8]
MNQFFGIHDQSHGTIVQSLEAFRYHKLKNRYHHGLTVLE